MPTTTSILHETGPKDFLRHAGPTRKRLSVPQPGSLSSLGQTTLTPDRCRAQYWWRADAAGSARA